MKKSFGIALIVALVAFIAPFQQARAATIAELEAQILTLEAQLTAPQGQVAGVTNDSCLNLTYNLAFGSTDAQTNGEVSKLQAFLGGEVTGYFGSVTEQLVKNWQAAHGVVSSGTPDTTGYGAVGPKTRAAIFEYSCSTAQLIAVDPSQDIVVAAIDTDADASGKYGTFTIVFEVDAIDADWYIPASAAMSGNAVGAIFAVQGGSVSTTSVASLLQSSADKVGNYFIAREGETEEFTLTVTVSPAFSGDYSVALTQLNMAGTASVPTHSVRVGAEEDFETDSISITGSYLPNATTTPVITFNATPLSVNYGGVSKLDWNVQYANVCFLNYDATQTSVSPTIGSMTVILKTTTVYTLRCGNEIDGKDGPVAEKKVTVTVNSGPITGSVNTASYTTAYPTLTGTASGTEGLTISINNGDKLYGSGTTLIPVIGGKWSHKVTTPLPNGTLTVNLYANNTQIGSGSITVAAPPSGIVNSRTYETNQPPLTGRASGTRTVAVTIINSNDRTVYQSEGIPVTDGRWSHKVATILPNGTYSVWLYANDTKLYTATIIVNVTVAGAINSRTYATATPPLTGTARGTSSVRVVVMRDGVIVHEGKNIPVTDERWSHKVSTDLANGTYTTYLYAGNVQIATGTIIIAQS